jgi:hypothetical protein
MALWFRVGAQGPVFRGTRATNSFTAESAGTLELGSYLPGGWADPTGTPVASTREYRRMSGGMSVLVIRWSPGADSGELLRRLAQADGSGIVAAELDRRAGEWPEPDGWRHLWEIGRSETIRDDGPRIACHSHRDVAIVRREVDAPLTDSTRLRWAWRVDELPSELAEDTLLTHDYLSIGLEFDNGQDLTWHWSAELPLGYGYRCPLPAWKDRETHVVVRSGTADLGRWVSEEVGVRSQYARHVGEPPERIMAIWLLAVTTFQRGTGRCAYEGIELSEVQDVASAGGAGEDLARATLEHGRSSPRQDPRPQQPGPGRNADP